MHVQSLVGPITLNPAAPPDQDTERLPSSANTKVAVVTAAPNTEAVDASVEPQLASQTGMEEAALTRGSLAGASEASSHADLEDLAIAMSHTVSMLLLTCLKAVGGCVAVGSDA